MTHSKLKAILIVTELDKAPHPTGDSECKVQEQLHRAGKESNVPVINKAPR
jgi:hypothetical protein